MSEGERVIGDAFEWMRFFAKPASYQFAYIDPPFNTGLTRVGDAGSYNDSYAHEDYLMQMRRILVYLRECLTVDGAVAVHLDWRECHYVRVILDEVFGRDAFINEIIWSYDFGGRGKRCWPRKHDNIAIYARTPGKHYFDWDAVPRVPYMMKPGKNPRFVTAEKAARGKTLTDVWWRSVIGTNSYERTGYPTQKPIDIIQRLISVHSGPGGKVLDVFGGSGTTGAACEALDRPYTLVDKSLQAHAVMEKRLQKCASVTYLFENADLTSDI